ncbi:MULTISPECIES: helix-turn-helix domain-containing protein [unclassified Butyrivibrio]|uniref:helix-turn-helix domain-containing protein n=1 Tax=unclassified Butyrivibrio TaxID=2639466 RepID=UPI0003F78D33|nr:MULTISPECIES: AraC family transcriptional regulator [unclassified Butyrivibrio]
MIETLNGLIETVNFNQSTSVKLYNNNEYEDYPAHWHAAIEIIMPTSNLYYLNCAGEDIVLREEDIIIICPGCIHSIKAPEIGKRIIFQPDTTELRFMHEIDGLINLMSPYTIVTPEEYPQIHDHAKSLLLEINEIYSKNDSFSEVDIFCKLLAFLSLIGKNYVDKRENSNFMEYQRGDEYFGKFLEICDYIQDHCSEDLSLDEIADKSGFSKFYFSRRFKQFTNVSFYKYVNQKRIAKAETFLTDPSNSVTDVALNCGFPSLSSFIRMFKIIKGCTPTEFRNMYWCAK